MKKLALLLTIVTLVAAGCAADAAPGADPTGANSTPAPAPALGEPEYYAAVVNALAEVAPLQANCVERLSPPPAEGGFSPEGASGGDEPAFDAALIRRILTECFVSLHDEATEAIAALGVPQSVNSPHDDFMAARWAWSQLAGPLVDAIESEADLEAFFTNPAVVAALDAEVAACETLQAEATRLGLLASLPCLPFDDAGREGPPPRPTEVVLALIDEDGWTLEPPGSIDSGGGVDLVIQNVDDVPHRPALAEMFSGEPDALPVVEGLVDLSQSGVAMAQSASPERGYFGLRWPEVTGEGFTGPVPELAPGEEIRFVITDGVWVFFDHVPGAYEAGVMATLVVASQQAITDTYVTPASAIESCDELAAFIGGLYTAYAEELRHVSAEGFEESPLSMIDDLRFGAALQRVDVLGCDAHQVEAGAREAFCPTEAVEGTASRVIWERICSGE